MEALTGGASTGQVSEKASAQQEGRRTSDSPCCQRQLGTSCSPFHSKTKQGKMGLNCSKGDLGQIAEKPAGATRNGDSGLMEFPSLEASGTAFKAGLTASPGQTAGLPVKHHLVALWLPSLGAGREIMGGCRRLCLLSVTACGEPLLSASGQRPASLCPEVSPSLDDSFVCCQSTHNLASRAVMSQWLPHIRAEAPGTSGSSSQRDRK